MANFIERIKKIRRLFQPEPLSVGLTDLLEESLRIESSEQRTLWLENGLRWLLKESGGGDRYVRCRFLFQLLEQRPDWRAAVSAEVAVCLSEHGMLSLFAQTGVSADNGLFHEIGQRVLRRILPRVHEATLLEIVDRVFRTADDVEWLQEMSEEIYDRLCGVLDESAAATVLVQAQGDAREALILLSGSLIGLGPSNDLRARSSNAVPSESPFLKLQLSVTEVVSLGSLSADAKDRIHRLVGECQAAVQIAYGDMETSGASVALVYRLEKISAILTRMKKLLRILDRDAAQNSSSVRSADLVTDLVSAAFEGWSIIGHTSRHLHLLSRKIAERNGNSGEHYIARSGREQVDLFRSAIGGGVIVVLMTLTKLALHELQAPPLVQAILVWAIYTSGFLLMQFTHTTLATKLPSFTASKLARLMNDVRRTNEVAQFTAEIKTVVRSQIIAFAGNLVGLIPLAFALNLGVSLLVGDHLLSRESALENLAALHPYKSLAIALGALTGVLLWLSSLAGGWLENWIVFRQLPRAIGENRNLRRIFGVDGAFKFGEWTRQNASGIGANVSLGFLFGFVPFFGSILGLPLDSKHVTISSTVAVFSMLSVGGEPDGGVILAATVAGLFCIGLMNLAVSFALALIVAGRASDVHPERFRRLIRLSARRLLGGAKS